MLDYEFKSQNGFSYWKELLLLLFHIFVYVVHCPFSSREFTSCHGTVNKLYGKETNNPLLLKLDVPVLWRLFSSFKFIFSCGKVAVSL